MSYAKYIQSIVLREERSEKPNGNLPLMCRLTVNGEIKQFSCKMDVPLRLWDVKNSRAPGKSVKAQRINLAVDKIRVEVNRRYQELMQTDGYVITANLKVEVVDLQQQKETAREELRRAKKEIQTEKLKWAATTTASNIAESIGPLFDSNKVKTFEKENTVLHKEIADQYNRKGKAKEWNCNQLTG